MAIRRAKIKESMCRKVDQGNLVEREAGSSLLCFIYLSGIFGSPPGIKFQGTWGWIDAPKH